MYDIWSSVAPWQLWLLIMLFYRNVEIFYICCVCVCVCVCGWKNKILFMWYNTICQTNFYFLLFWSIIELECWIIFALHLIHYFFFYKLIFAFSTCI
jgi:hypothetical protein